MSKISNHKNYLPSTFQGSESYDVANGRSHANVLKGASIPIKVKKHASSYVVNGDGQQKGDGAVTVRVSQGAETSTGRRVAPDAMGKEYSHQGSMSSLKNFTQPDREQNRVAATAQGMIANSNQASQRDN